MSYRRNDRNDHQPASGIHELEPVTWASKTYMLPKLIPSTSDPITKQTFFTTTYDIIRNGPGDYQTKVDLFKTRFLIGTAKCHEAEDLLRLMYNPTAQAIRFTNPAVFRFNEIALFDFAGNRINNFDNNFGLHLDDIYPPHIRSNARILSTRARVYPAGAYEFCEIAPRDFSIAIRLPVEPNTNMFPDWLHGRTLRDPAALLDTLTAFDNGLAPKVGTLKVNGGIADIDVDGFHHLFTKFYFQCLFDVLHKLIEPAFMGPLRPASLQHLITGCKQSVYNKTTQRWTNLSVQEYYEKFSAALQTLPSNVPYQLDIAALFYNNLSHHLQELLQTKNYQPPAPQPFETNAAASQRLLAVRDKAIQVESDYAVHSRLYNQRHWNPPAARTQAFHTDFSSHAFLALTEASALPPIPPTAASPVPTFPPQQHDDQALLATNITPNTATHHHTDAATDQAMVYLSLAEELLQKASGNTHPRECWGCSTIPRYQQSCQHVFRDCPHRDDPEVQQHFRQAFQEFLRSRRDRNRKTHDTTATVATALPPENIAAWFTARKTQLNNTWQAEGYPSLEQAVLTCQLADPTTPPVVRTACFATLTNRATRNAKHNTDFDDHTPNSKRPKPPSNNFYCLLTIPLIPEERIAAYQATLQRMQAALHVSQVLPHIRFPIGPKTSPQGTLVALVDTGAGLNVGRYSYHKHIAKTRPHLVLQFANLKDLADARPFGVGGLNGAGNGTDIEAIITYRTPFYINGRQVAISFGLGHTVATNTILSCPFLQAIQASLMFDSMTCMSGLLGESFPMDMMVPPRADAAPILPTEAPAAYTAQQQQQPSLLPTFEHGLLVLPSTL